MKISGLIQYIHTRQVFWWYVLTSISKYPKIRLFFVGNSNLNLLRGMQKGLEFIKVGIKENGFFKYLQIKAEDAMFFIIWNVNNRIHTR